MVSIELKNEIKSIVGHGTIKKFQQYLIANKVLNRNNKHYSHSSVQNYLAVHKANSKLDDHFIRFSNQELDEIKKTKRKELKLLKQKKELAE